MTKHQENQHTMHLKLERVCDENVSVYQRLTAFGNSLGIFKQNNRKIDATMVKQKTPTIGYTEKRDQVRSDLAELSVEVAGSVLAYAHANRNDVLARKVDYSYTDLTRASDVAVRNKTTIILNEAKNIVANLADYGTDNLLLTQMEEKLNEFTDIVGIKGYSKEETQTATEQIAELLAENNALLKNRLDKLMLKFRKTDPVFYKNYFNAREIYNFGGNHNGKNHDETPPRSL